MLAAVNDYYYYLFNIDHFGVPYKVGNKTMQHPNCIICLWRQHNLNKKQYKLHKCTIYCRALEVHCSRVWITLSFLNTKFCSEVTRACGPALPPGDVCQDNTLICSVIRGDSARLLFMVKINSALEPFAGVFRETISMFSQHISVLFVLLTH